MKCRFKREGNGARCQREDCNRYVPYWSDKLVTVCLTKKTRQSVAGLVRKRKG